MNTSGRPCRRLRDTGRHRCCWWVHRRWSHTRLRDRAWRHDRFGHRGLRHKRFGRNRLRCNRWRHSGRNLARWDGARLDASRWVNRRLNTSGRPCRRLRDTGRHRRCWWIGNRLPQAVVCTYQGWGVKWLGRRASQAGRSGLRESCGGLTLATNCAVGVADWDRSKLCKTGRWGKRGSTAGRLPCQRRRGEFRVLRNSGGFRNRGRSGS